MALLSTGLGLGGELGLRLLLSPGSSSILVRSACGIVGIGMPVYCTYKCIERRERSADDEAEKNHWLTYWAVCGCLSVAESYGERWVSWVPFYYHVKLAFLIWLQVPASSSGAKLLYLRILRPLLRRHQSRVDKLVTGARTHLGRFVEAHQAELVYASQILRRVALAVLRFGQDSYAALREPDESPQPSVPPSPTLLDAASPSDSAPASASSSPLLGAHQQNGHLQGLTRRAPPFPQTQNNFNNQSSPPKSPPYRGANASPVHSYASTPPGPNTFPSGSPSHQQNVYETQHVRNLRSMYQVEGQAKSGQHKGAW